MESAVNQQKEEAERNEVLLWACARGLLYDVVELVKQGADPNTRDKHGRRALHFAAAHGHADICEFLATRGADTDPDDAKGRAPLHYAALGGHAEVVRYLLSKSAWVDATDGADDTPLHLAARGLPPSIDTDKPGSAPGTGAPGPTIRALTEAGAKLELRNKRGFTPLTEAVAACSAEAVAALLDKRALLTAPLPHSLSLLHLAAGQPGDLGRDCLERLLTEGRRPETDEAGNEWEMTALHAAAASGNTQCADLLLRYGADPTAQDAVGQLAWQLVPEDPEVLQPLHEPPVPPLDPEAELRALRGEAAAPQAPHLKVPPPSKGELQRLRDRLKKAAEARAAKDGGTAQKAAQGAAAGKAGAAKAAGGSAKGGAAGSGSGKPASASAQQQEQAKEVEEQLSFEQRFARLPAEEQGRKADAYARMEDADMRRIPSLPQPALAPLQALRRAAALLECWRAVAALRQDEDLQEALSDPAVAAAIEDMRRPGADVDKYRSDRQIAAVLSKLNKLHGVMRASGQTWKVNVEDLRAGKSGPSSVAETLRQLQVLEGRWAAARADAVRALCGRPEPEPGSGSEPGQGQGSISGAAAGAAEAAAAGSQGDGGGSDAKGLRDQVDAVSRGLDELTRGAQAGEAGEQLGRPAPRTAREWVAQAGRELGYHVLRACAMACIMLFVMHLMGMMPDQIRAKIEEQQAALAKAAQSAAASGVDVLGGLQLQGIEDEGQGPAAPA